MVKLLIGMATYNQRHHIEKLIGDIHIQLPGQNILVIDDNSPDGTGKFLNDLIDRDPLLRVLHRPKRLGLGTAHMALMEYAMEKGFDGLITLGTEAPVEPLHLPQMAGHLENYDFVLGSRDLKGGPSFWKSPWQSFMTLLNFWAGKIVGGSFQEALGLFRGYKTPLLKQLRPRSFKSTGGPFFIESLLSVVKMTPKIKEFPVPFHDESDTNFKAKMKEVADYLVYLVPLTWKKIKTSFK